MTASSKIYKSAQEILDDLHALWFLAERLEKESLESFDWDDPIMEQLGFACIHLMNAHMGIQELVSKSSNKLESNSANQFLDILLCIKGFGCQNWWDIVRAYRKGVVNVATSYFVKRATIRDLCTRRLHVNTEKFLGLVDEWLFRNSDALKQLLKRHTYPHQHQKIDDFFDEERSVQ